MTIPQTAKATSLFEHIEKFATEDDCRAHLEKIRFPNGLACTRCGSKKVWEYKHRFEYLCGDCNYHFSVTSGTIFQDSHIKLTKWFYAIHLIVNAKKSLSAMQLQREIGVTYKTAWFLAHRIREAMIDEGSDFLHGKVEVDETYVGGKPRKTNKRKDDKPNKRGRGTKKTPVVGAKERGGDVHAKTVENVTSTTLLKFVQMNCNPSTVIYTDAFGGYVKVAKKFNHQMVDHQEMYVMGDIHTNGIENFWSLLKHGIIGSFHKVSTRHLDRYLAEFTCRFNARHSDNLFDSILAGANGRRLTYARLIAREG